MATTQLLESLTENQKTKVEKFSNSALFLGLCRQRRFWYCCAAIFTVKCLLIPCYYSTDFEVHRNWMAVTHTLPIRLWYYDNTSQWTIDYPPFFSFFEYLLSKVASKIIPSALVLQKDAFFSYELLYFHRFSVIAADFVYVLLCVFLSRSFSKCEEEEDGITTERSSEAAQLLLITNASLIMIDNIHFQYNGILTAVLLLSLGFIMRKSYLFGALSYCILLNMKHIYLCYAPAYALLYAVYYLPPFRKAFAVRCVKLAALITLPFALSFGPFIVSCGPDVLHQIWRRLFPFERGLTHAYWAPNLWALYNFADWYCYEILKLTNRLPSDVHPPSYTSGLVQEFKHSILPSVTPFGTLLTTGTLLLPLLLLVPTRHSKNFPLLLTLSAFAFFLAGYHVHEKAVILITIPYTVVASLDHRFLPSFVLLSYVANISLFPLFFTPFENVLKVAITLCYLCFSKSVMKFLCPGKTLCVLQKLFMFGLLVVQVYCLVLHQVLFDTRLKFIPLMFTSVTTAFGILWVYLEVLWIKVRICVGPLSSEAVSTENIRSPVMNNSTKVTMKTKLKTEEVDALLPYVFICIGICW